MTLYSILAVMLMVAVAMVTGLSVVPGSDPILPPDFRPFPIKKIPKIFPPGPITVQPPPHLDWPPRYCTCEIRCCKYQLEPRRAVSGGGPSGGLPALIDTPLVRHKRCCGCHPCDWFRRVRLLA
ncbi:uncharacterized protein LOC143297836 [Babylonia areolata]|uniref:uncharacterized protein LOC143297836 n=1 Tax=Babylonia areolata TaxID=304850 RepID=UPI003FD674AF